MNHPKIYHLTLLISLLTILPATASKQPQYLQEVNTSLQQQPDSQLKMQGLLGLGNSLRALRMLEQKPTTANQDISLGAKETLLQSLKIATNFQDRSRLDHLKLLRNDLKAIDADLQFSFRDSIEPVYREYVNLLLRLDRLSNLLKDRSAKIPNTVLLTIGQPLY